MKTIRKEKTGNRGRYIFILIFAVPIILFHIFKNNRAVMDFIAQNITVYIKKVLNRICSIFPFSVTEIIIALAVVGIFVFLIRTIIYIKRSGRKLNALWRRITALLCAGVFIYFEFCLMWGVNFYTSNIEAKTGIYARESTVQELYETAVYFAEKVSELGEKVPRNSDGIFAPELSDIFSASVNVYDNISKEYECFEYEDTVPKKIICSKIMSYMDCTGLYFPFTAESNINIDVPLCLMPSTIAHELGHQRGISSEKEANFAAILACTSCNNILYQYSGYLLGYIYLNNALYDEDGELFSALRENLSENVKNDLRANSEYWQQFETRVSEVSSSIYDSMLKGYGETLGTKSYGAVVDLLIAYYN